LDDTVLLLRSGEEAWWKILGVAPEADQTAIRNAYRALARIHHPDTGGDPAEFQRLGQAYEAALVHLEKNKS
jgi:DnaJ-class molecular chaperone